MITIGVALMVCVGLAIWRYRMPGLLRLAELRLHGIALLFAAAGLQAALVAGWLPALWCTLATTVLLACFGVLNRKTYGIPWAVGGALLNMALMVLHDGRMPVNPAASAFLGGELPPPGQILSGTKGVFAAHGSLLSWLGDAIPLPGAVTGWALWSVGDLLLLGGILVMLSKTMKGDRAHGATA